MDTLAMIPMIWQLANALPWDQIGWGLFLVSEGLAAVPSIKANGVFQGVYNFLARFKKS